MQTDIGTFDEFENFLYYQSSSALFSNDIPSINPNVSFITGSYINPVPKTNNSIPYQLQSVTSSIKLFRSKKRLQYIFHLKYPQNNYVYQKTCFSQLPGKNILYQFFFTRKE